MLGEMKKKTFGRYLLEWLKREANFAVPEQSIAQQICNIEYQALEATQSIVLANHDDDNDHEDCDDDIEGTEEKACLDIRSLAG